jgi:hypothetical protein
VEERRESLPGTEQKMSVGRADMRRSSFMSRSLVRLCWRSGEQTDWETEDWNVSWEARTEVRAELANARRIVEGWRSQLAELDRLNCELRSCAETGQGEVVEGDGRVGEVKGREHTYQT